MELPALYLKTEVTVYEDGEWVPAHRSALARAGAFHVITAWNPDEERPGREQNRAANRRLFEQLAEFGLDPVPAMGSDPDSDHEEESWATAGLGDIQARRIGANYGQVAVFRITAFEQTVLACTESWTATRKLS